MDSTPRSTIVKLREDELGEVAGELSRETILDEIDEKLVLEGLFVRLPEGSTAFSGVHRLHIFGQRIDHDR